MEVWHPRAQRVIPTARQGLSHLGVPWKIVLHTTEAYAYSPSTASYYGHQSWPHATITPGRIYQHFPLSKAVFTLKHDFGPHTNRANAIQCEVTWRAENPDWPDDLLDKLADWIRWVQAQTGVPTQFAEMYRPGTTLAVTSSPIRMSGEGFVNFHGICGHSNVPGGNTHWDPGRLPVDRLRARLDGDDDEPRPNVELDLFMFWHGPAIFLAFGGRVSPHGLQPKTVDALVAAGIRVAGRPGDDAELMRLFGNVSISAEGSDVVAPEYPTDLLDELEVLDEYLEAVQQRPSPR